MAVLEPRTLRWRPGRGRAGARVVMQSEGEIRATSVVIGEHEGVAYGARYELVCDEQLAHPLAVDRMHATAARCSLESDGEGRWTDAAGKPLPALDGCIDIDLSASPLTNTLPVRRCGIDPAMGTMRFRMASFRSTRWSRSRTSRSIRRSTTRAASASRPRTDLRGRDHHGRGPLRPLLSAAL